MTNLSAFLIIGGYILALSIHRRSNVIFGALSYFFGILLYYFALRLNTLSLDSFIEVSNGDVADAYWILKNEYLFFIQGFIPPKIVIFTNALASEFICLTTLIIGRTFKYNAKPYILLILTSVAIVNIATPLREFYGSGKTFLKLRDNYSLAHDAHGSIERDIDVFLLVGESIGTQNMSVYGYIHDTTPFLRSRYRDSNWIFFDNFFSRYTHTTPSMLDMLSEPIYCGDGGDVYSEQRAPLLKSLENAGVQYVYFSAQPQGGSANFALNILADSKSLVHMKPTLGEQLKKDSIISFEEMQFFEHSLQAFTDSLRSSARIMVLHSYSGHFPYNFLPKSAYKFNGTHEGGEMIFGKSGANISDLRKYNDSITYFDSIVSILSKKLHQHHKPAVLVVTADHGESIYTKSSHDSSRFQPEMVKVPFAIYLNDYAKAKYPELKLELDKDSRLLKSTKDIPNIIRKTLGASSPRCINKGSSIKNKIQHDSEAENTGFFRFDHPVLSLYADSQTDPKKNYCYHGVITEGSAARARQFTECVEFNVTNKTFSGLINQLENYRKWGFRRLWVDLGHDKFDAVSICRLHEILDNHKNYFESFIIELNEDSLSSFVRHKCALDTSTNNFYLQLNTDVLRRCEKSISFDQIDCAGIEKVIVDYIKIGYSSFTLDSVGARYLNNVSSKFPGIKIALWNYSKNYGPIPGNTTHVMYRFDDPNWLYEK
jgi:glucan phosphoethanolaminetransferase (alkaline phosphatase superfamily)